MVKPAFADMLNPWLDVPRFPDLEFLPAQTAYMQLPSAPHPMLGKPDFGVAGAGWFGDLNDLDDPFGFMDANFGRNRTESQRRFPAD